MGDNSEWDAGCYSPDAKASEILGVADTSAPHVVTPRFAAKRNLEATRKIVEDWLAKGVPEVRVASPSWLKPLPSSTPSASWIRPLPSASFSGPSKMLSNPKTRSAIAIALSLAKSASITAECGARMAKLSAQQVEATLRRQSQVPATPRPKKRIAIAMAQSSEKCFESPVSKVSSVQSVQSPSVESSFEGSPGKVESGGENDSSDAEAETTVKKKLPKKTSMCRKNRFGKNSSRPKSCKFGAIWDDKVKLYKQTKAELAVKYPGTQVQGSSFTQTRYWSFMSEKIKDYKGKGTQQEMRSAMARAAAEWKMKLEAEFIDSKAAEDEAA